VSLSTGTLEALADELVEAEQARSAVGRLTERVELDVADAYEVQRIGFARRLAAGDRPLGHKLGLTSRAKQEAMGVAEPLWGRLSASMVHSEDAPLAVDTLIHPRVEPEIAFLLGADVDGPTATVAGVLAATAGLLPALEILDSRFAEFSFALPDVIADNASAALIVLGGRLLPPSALDLQTEGMVLRRSGDVVATAAGAAISGHPASAVAWLAREAGGLEAGSIVLSGGLTAPVALEAGVAISAEFTHLGTVGLRCT
jgi:2-keto-4-pentenoate hydratase